MAQRSPFRTVIESGKNIGKNISGVFSGKKAKSDNMRIGVIFSGTSGSSVDRIYSGCREVFSERGYETLLFNTGNSQAKEEKILKELLDRGVRGFIIEPSKSQILCHHMDLYKKMDRDNIPYVFIHSTYPLMNDKPKVLIDDVHGGYILTRHLIATGREYIAGIFKADDSRGYNRHRGYVKALQEAGIAYDPESVIWYHTEDGYRRPAMAFEQMLSDKPSVDGVVCYNDIMAGNILYKLVSKGYRVPEDVAVTGYDNSVSANNGELALTTVAPPDGMFGNVAGMMLLDRIEGAEADDKKAERILIPELVIRGSTVN